MNKVSILLLGLLFVSTCAVPAAEDEVSESEKIEFQQTVSIEDGEHVDAVTPLKSIFLPSMARSACWLCGSPCSSYYCCTPYPRCCIVSGRCRCCR